MRILVLAPGYVLPPSDGVRLRLGNLLRRLPSSWSVKLLAFDDIREAFDQPLPDPFRGMATRVPLPPAPPGFCRSPLFQLARPQASLIWKFRSREMARLVRKHAQGCDAALAVGLQMGQYLRWVPQGMPTALDSYNVESLILARLARTRPGPKRCYWLLEACKLRRTERLILESAGTVFAISDVDRAHMEALAPRARVRTVPMGIHVEHFHPKIQAPRPGGPIFTFAGVFNWHVNEDAACWLCREVWPRVRATLPQARLHLVGRDPSEQVRALAQDPSIRVTGTVPDIRPHLWQSTALLVPLRYGSGVRTKILEGFAAERPVVSTRVGCEGLPVREDAQILVADSAEEFARACIRLVEDPVLSQSLVASAKDWVRAHDEQATALLHEVLADAFAGCSGQPGGTPAAEVARR